MIIESYDVRCDHCGKQLDCGAGSESKAIRMATGQGWKHDDEDGDKCPKCQGHLFAPSRNDPDICGACGSTKPSHRAALS